MRRKLRIENAGDDSVRIQLLGDRRQPEPSTLRVCFPGGEVEIARTTSDDYWVHVRELRSDDGLLTGHLASARVDNTKTPVVVGGSEVGFGDDTYHMAILVKRGPRPAPSDLERGQSALRSTRLARGHVYAAIAAIGEPDEAGLLSAVQFLEVAVDQLDGAAGNIEEEVGRQEQRSR